MPKASKAKLKRLARGIVLAQGNRYIKELLRKHNVRIGATKTEFQANLIEAIANGLLTQDHFDEWLDEIEGWGNQHVYLYQMPKRGRSKLASQLKKRAKQHRLFNSSPSLAFPRSRKLTGIYCNDTSFQLVWHEGFETWIREKVRDFQETEGPDLYEYRAYREQPKRSVMRFVWPFNTEICAIFLQIPWDENEHRSALTMVWDALGAFDMKIPLPRVSLDERIRAIDRVDTHADDVTVQSTRLSTPGAYVDFVSTVPDRDFKDAQAIAHVHRAVEHENFAGARGAFVFRQRDDDLTRDVRIQMYGAQDRIRFWAQCTKSDVWTILRRITTA